MYSLYMYTAHNDRYKQDKLVMLTLKQMKDKKMKVD